MPIETPQGNLDIKNATLRTSNLETQNIKIGSIFVGTGNSLEETANVGNSMSNTIQFTNTHTAFTTTGNVEVGGELTVSGNVSDLNVVSNVNLLHTSNTAALKLNSNVVTEFPRSKKLIKYPRVAMTQNDESGTSGYVAEQTNYSGYPTDGYAYRLFDNTSGAYQSGSVYSGGNPTASAPTTTASDGSTHQGVAITLDLVTEIRLDHVVFTSHANYGRTPVDGTFLGSNNSSTWDVIHTFSGLSTSNNNQKHTINITNSSQKLAYRYIRFVITKIHTSSVFNGGGLLEFRELEYYGTPEYDSDADGVNVVVKSVPNVPNTDWLDIYIDGQDYSTMPSGAGSVLDKSTNNRHGTPSNVTFNSTWKAFEIESASTSNINIPFNSTGGDYIHTIALWFLMDTTAGGNRCIFTIRGSESPGRQIALMVNQDSTSVGFKYDFYGGDVRYHDPSVVANKWMHVALTYSGGDNSVTSKEIYLNGVRLGVTASNSTALNLTGSENLLIGGNLNSSNASFEGMVANFRMFNRVLSKDDIYQLYAYQKEYFGHGDLSMTLKAGRLGIGTSEPKAALDVRGDAYYGCPVFFTAYAGGNGTVTGSSTGTVIVFNKTVVNKGGAYDISNGRCTFPVSGYYEVFFRGGTASTVDFHAKIYRNGNAPGSGGWPNNLPRLWDHGDMQYRNAGTIQFFYYFTAGEYIEVRLTNSSVFNADNYNSFSVKYLSN